MHAVIRTGGKQYLVAPEQTITIEKLAIEAGQPVVFDDVLLVGDTEATLGNPTVNGAKVEGTVLTQERTDKVIGVKFHNKVRYHRKFGHRQQVTTVKITKISA
ncbi:MAG: 50S ribosomal protein L21 [Patescibacteria group bacterium]